MSLPLIGDRTKAYEQLARRIRDAMTIDHEIEDGLVRDAPFMCIELYGKKNGKLTLREAARQCGLSPTYLSQVSKGNVEISRGAYLKLHKLYQKVCQ